MAKAVIKQWKEFYNKFNLFIKKVLTDFKKYGIL